MPTEQEDWFTCPVCGQVVKANALACPDCGADDETGWSQDAEYDGVDLPDDGDPDAPKSSLAKTITIIIAMLLVGMMLLISIGAL